MRRPKSRKNILLVLLVVMGMSLVAGVPAIGAWLERKGDTSAELVTAQNGNTIVLSQAEKISFRLLINEGRVVSVTITPNGKNIMVRAEFRKWPEGTIYTCSTTGTPKTCTPKQPLEWDSVDVHGDTGLVMQLTNPHTPPNTVAHR